MASSTHQFASNSKHGRAVPGITDTLDETPNIDALCRTADKRNDSERLNVYDVDSVYSNNQTHLPEQLICDRYVVDIHEERENNEYCFTSKWNERGLPSSHFHTSNENLMLNRTASSDNLGFHSSPSLVVMTSLTALSDSPDQSCPSTSKSVPQPNSHIEMVYQIPRWTSEEDDNENKGCPEVSSLGNTNQDRILSIPSTSLSERLQMNLSSSYPEHNRMSSLDMLKLACKNFRTERMLLEKEQRQSPNGDVQPHSAQESQVKRSISDISLAVLATRPPHFGAPDEPSKSQHMPDELSDVVPHSILNDADEVTIIRKHHTRNQERDSAFVELKNISLKSCDVLEKPSLTHISSHYSIPIIPTLNKGSRENGFRKHSNTSNLWDDVRNSSTQIASDSSDMKENNMSVCINESLNGAGITALLEGNEDNAETLLAPTYACDKSDTEHQCIRIEIDLEIVKNVRKVLDDNLSPFITEDNHDKELLSENKISYMTRLPHSLPEKSLSQNLAVDNTVCLDLTSSHTVNVSTVSASSANIQGLTAKGMSYSVSISDNVPPTLTFSESSARMVHHIDSISAKYVGDYCSVSRESISNSCQSKNEEEDILGPPLRATIEVPGTQIQNHATNNSLSETAESSPTISIEVAEVGKDVGVTLSNPIKRVEEKETSDRKYTTLHQSVKNQQQKTPHEQLVRKIECSESEINTSEKRGSTSEISMCLASVINQTDTPKSRITFHQSPEKNRLPDFLKHDVNKCVTNTALDNAKSLNNNNTECSTHLMELKSCVMDPSKYYERCLALSDDKINSKIIDDISLNICHSVPHASRANEKHIKAFNAEKQDLKKTNLQVDNGKVIDTKCLVTGRNKSVGQRKSSFVSGKLFGQVPQRSVPQSCSRSVPQSAPTFNAALKSLSKNVPPVLNKTKGIDEDSEATLQKTEHKGPFCASGKGKSTLKNLPQSSPSLAKLLSERSVKKSSVVPVKFVNAPIRSTHINVNNDIKARTKSPSLIQRSCPIARSKSPPLIQMTCPIARFKSPPLIKKPCLIATSKSPPLIQMPCPIARSKSPPLIRRPCPMSKFQVQTKTTNRLHQEQCKTQNVTPLYRRLIPANDKDVSSRVLKSTIYPNRGDASNNNQSKNRVTNKVPVFPKVCKRVSKESTLLKNNRKPTKAVLNRSGCSPNNNKRYWPPRTFLIRREISPKCSTNTIDIKDSFTESALLDPNVSEIIMETLVETVKRGLKISSNVGRNTKDPEDDPAYRCEPSVIARTIMKKLIGADDGRSLTPSDKALSCNIDSLVDSMNSTIDGTVDKRICWDSSLDSPPRSRTERKAGPAVIQLEIVKAGHSVINTMTNTLGKFLSDELDVFDVSNFDTFDPETSMSMVSRNYMKGSSRVSSSGLLRSGSRSLSRNLSVSSTSKEKVSELLLSMTAMKTSSMSMSAKRVPKSVDNSRHAVAALEDLEALAEGLTHRPCSRNPHTVKRRTSQTPPASMKLLDAAPAFKPEPDIVRYETMGDATVLTTARLPIRAPFRCRPSSPKSVKSVKFVDSASSVEGHVSTGTSSGSSWQLRNRRMQGGTLSEHRHRRQNQATSATANNVTGSPSAGSSSSSFLRAKKSLGNSLQNCHQQKRLNSVSVSDAYVASNSRSKLLCSHRLSCLATPRMRHAVSTKVDHKHILKRSFLGHLDRIIDAYSDRIKEDQNKCVKKSSSGTECSPKSIPGQSIKVKAKAIASKKEKEATPNIRNTVSTASNKKTPNTIITNKKVSAICSHSKVLKFDSRSEHSSQSNLIKQRKVNTPTAKILASSTREKVNLSPCGNSGKDKNVVSLSRLKNNIQSRFNKSRSYIEQHFEAVNSYRTFGADGTARSMIIEESVEEGHEANITAALPQKPESTDNAVEILLKSSMNDVGDTTEKVPCVEPNVDHIEKESTSEPYPQRQSYGRKNIKNVFKRVMNQKVLSEMSDEELMVSLLTALAQKSKEDELSKTSLTLSHSSSDTSSSSSSTSSFRSSSNSSPFTSSNSSSNASSNAPSNISSASSSNTSSRLESITEDAVLENNGSKERPDTREAYLNEVLIPLQENCSSRALFNAVKKWLVSDSETSSSSSDSSDDSDNNDDETVYFSSNDAKTSSASDVTSRPQGSAVNIKENKPSFELNTQELKLSTHIDVAFGSSAPLQKALSSTQKVNTAEDDVNIKNTGSHIFKDQVVSAVDICPISDEEVVILEGLSPPLEHDTEEMHLQMHYLIDTSSVASLEEPDCIQDNSGDDTEDCEAEIFVREIMPEDVFLTAADVSTNCFEIGNINSYQSLHEDPSEYFFADSLSGDSLSTMNPPLIDYVSETLVSDNISEGTLSSFHDASEHVFTDNFSDGSIPTIEYTISDSYFTSMTSANILPPADFMLSQHFITDTVSGVTLSVVDIISPESIQNILSVLSHSCIEHFGTRDVPSAVLNIYTNPVDEVQSEHMPTLIDRPHGKHLTTWTREATSARSEEDHSSTLQYSLSLGAAGVSEQLWLDAEEVGCAGGDAAMVQADSDTSFGSIRSIFPDQQYDMASISNLSASTTVLVTGSVADNSEFSDNVSRVESSSLDECDADLSSTSSELGYETSKEEVNEDGVRYRSVHQKDVTRLEKERFLKDMAMYMLHLEKCSTPMSSVVDDLMNAKDIENDVDQGPSSNLDATTDKGSIDSDSEHTSTSIACDSSLPLKEDEKRKTNKTIYPNLGDSNSKRHDATFNGEEAVDISTSDAQKKNKRALKIIMLAESLMISLVLMFIFITEPLAKPTCE